MATPTPNQGIPLPDSTDADNVPYAFSQAVGAIEPRLVMRFATTTARDAVLTAPQEGMTAYLTTPDLLTVYSNGAWRTIPLVGGSDVAGVPYSWSAGTVSVTATAATNGSAAVTFPASRFSVAPIVTVQPQATQSWIGTTSGVTATGFTAGIRHVDNTATTATVTVHWHAVQMTLASASG